MLVTSRLNVGLEWLRWCPISSIPIGIRSNLTSWFSAPKRFTLVSVRRLTIRLSTLPCTSGVKAYDFAPIKHSMHRTAISVFFTILTPTSIRVLCLNRIRELTFPSKAYEEKKYCKVERQSMAFDFIIPGPQLVSDSPHCLTAIIYSREASGLWYQVPSLLYAVRSWLNSLGSNGSDNNLLRDWRQFIRPGHSFRNSG
jgi:hypothetical protein